MSFTLIIAGLAIAYFLYSRVIRMYLKIRYYEKQGAAFCKGVVPVLGNLPRFKHQLETYGSNDHPWVISIREDFGTHKLPKVIGVFNSFEPTFFITDPLMVHDMYVTQNKYFDKHESVANVLFPLSGNTIIF